jgi:hypothetical protein
MLASCPGEFVDAFNIKIPLASGERPCPRASKLKVQAEG